MTGYDTRADRRLRPGVTIEGLTRDAELSERTCRVNPRSDHPLAVGNRQCTCAFIRAVISSNWQYPASSLDAAVRPSRSSAVTASTSASRAASSGLAEYLDEMVRCQGFVRGRSLPGGRGVGLVKSYFL